MRRTTDLSDERWVTYTPTIKAAGLVFCGSVLVNATLLLPLPLLLPRLLLLRSLIRRLKVIIEGVIAVKSIGGMFMLLQLLVKQFTLLNSSSTNHHLPF